MLKVTVERVNKDPEIFTLLLEDPAPSWPPEGRGRPINTKVILTANGLKALQDAVAGVNEKSKSAVLEKV